MQGITVLSWNILAPIFVRPNPDDPTDFAFFACASEEDLAWEKRRPLIQQRLRSVSSDVLLLQECEFEKSEAGKWDVPLWLREECGYDAWRVPDFADSEWEHQFQRNLRVLRRGAVTGVAILWKTAAVRFVSCETTSRTLVVTVARGEVLFAIANVHLEGHPDLHEMRAKQLHSAVKRARKSAEAHLIVAGDFNSELGEVRRQNEQHRLRMVAAGPTWSNGERCLQIDHFLCDPSLEVVRVMEFFSELDAKQGMPNRDSPSDHAPLGIECRATPKLAAAAAAAEPGNEAVREARQREIEAMWAAIEAPEKVKGKPTPQQMEVLKAFAAAKKAFLGQFADPAELAHAKKVSK
jgi:mRNA deadenylase 3'-5' endonuclease subunit Ccr4